MLSRVGGHNVATDRGAGLESGVEDGLAVLIDEERVDGAPLVAAQEVLYLFQRGVDAHHTDGSVQREKGGTWLALIMDW